MAVSGIMLTGWQRYDHFGTLCELLPVGIPSLAVCLSTMQHAGVSKSDLQKVNSQLGCTSDGPIQWTIDMRDRPSPQCSYPGQKLLQGKLCFLGFSLLVFVYHNMCVGNGNGIHI